MPLTEQQRWQIIEARIDKLTMWVAKILRKKRLKLDSDNVNAIVAEVVLRVYKALGNYDESVSSNLDGYFYILVQRKTSKVLRSYARQQAKLPAHVSIVNIDELRDTLVDQKDYNNLHQIDIEGGYRLLGKLSARQRVIVEMRVAGATFDSIANKFGLSQSVVARTYYTAIETLRAIVNNES